MTSLCTRCICVSLLISNGVLTSQTLSPSLPWRLLKIPVDETAQLRGMLFVDDTSGWICAYKNTVLKTTNGGQTWFTLKTRFAEPDTVISRLWFADGAQGWAAGRIGHQPTIWETRDGGVSWAVKYRWPPSLSEAPGAILDIQFVDERRGWAVGYNGPLAIIAATADGGQTWRTQYSGSEITGQFSRVRFIDSRHGWALSPNGIMQTDDGGEWWNLRYFGSGLLHDIAVVSTSEAWVAAGWESLLHGKRSEWSEVNVAPVIGEGFLGWVKFSNQHVGWASGARGEVLMTRDGGATWRRDFPPKGILGPEMSTDEMVLTKSAVYIIANPGHLLVRSIT